MKKHIVHFFATNPDKNEVFATSNGFLFTENHQATSHANELGDVKVVKHSRDQYAADIEQYLNPKSEETPSTSGEPAADDKVKGKGNKGKGAKKDEQKKEGEEVKEDEEVKSAEEEVKE